MADETATGEVSPEDGTFSTEAELEKLVEAEGAEEAQAEQQAAAEAEAEIGSEQAQEKTEDAEDDKKSKTVPHGAFHEERERRKAAEKEAQDLRESMARVDERLKMLAAQQKPQQQPAADAMPDPDDDPVEALKWATKRIQALEGGNVQQAQAQQQQQEQQRVMMEYQASAQQFTLETPDFPAAYKHLVNDRVEELQELGATPAQALQQARNEEWQIVSSALRTGANPAQRLYTVAKRRGYKAESEAANDTTETAKQDLERIDRGQQEAASVGAAAGGGANAQITAQTLANMSDEEFLKACENGTFRDVMGG